MRTGEFIAILCVTAKTETKPTFNVSQQGTCTVAKSTVTLRSAAQLFKGVG